MQYQDEGYEDWYSDDPEEFGRNEGKKSRLGIAALASLILAGGFFVSTTLGATINIIDSTQVIIVRDNGSSFSIDAISGVVLQSSNNNSFTLTFDPSHTLLDSGKISQITLESKDHKYTVGDSGPGGGLVFFIASQAFKCGPTLSEMCNALEYTPNGSIAGGVDSRWAPNGQETVAIGDSARALGIGGGYSNSEAIVNQYTTIGGAPQSTYQAGKSRLFRGGGLSDWYMPSKDEMMELHKYAISNNFNNSMGYFNSSSEYTATRNWGMYFPYINQPASQTDSKLDNNLTWPIRSFFAPST